MSLKDKLEQKSQEERQRLLELAQQQEEAEKQRLLKESARLRKEEQERLLPVLTRISELEEEKRNLAIMRNSLAKSFTPDAEKKETLVGPRMREYSKLTDEAVVREGATLDALVEQHKTVLEKEGINTKEDFAAHADYATEEEVVAYQTANKNLAELGGADQKLKERLVKLGATIPEGEFTYDIAEQAIDEKMGRIDQEIAEENKKTPEGQKIEAVRMEEERSKKLLALAEKVFSKYSKVSINEFAPEVPQGSSKNWIVPSLDISEYQKLSPEDRDHVLEAVRAKAHKDIDAEYKRRADHTGLTAMREDLDRLLAYEKSRNAARDAIRDFASSVRTLQEKFKTIIKGYQEKENAQVLAKLVRDWELNIKGEGQSRLFGDVNFQEDDLQTIFDQMPALGDADFSKTSVRIPEEVIAYVNDLKSRGEKSVSVLETADPKVIEAYVKDNKIERLKSAKILIQNGVTKEKLGQTGDFYKFKNAVEATWKDAEEKKKQFFELADVQAELHVIPLEAERLRQLDIQKTGVNRPYDSMKDVALEIEKIKAEKIKASQAEIAYQSLETKYAEELNEPIIFENKNGRVTFSKVQAEMDEILRENKKLDEEKAPFLEKIKSIKDEGYTDNKFNFLKKSKEKYDSEIAEEEKKITEKQTAILANGEKYKLLIERRALEKNPSALGEYYLSIESDPTTLGEYFTAIKAAIEKAKSVEVPQEKEALLKKWNETLKKEGEVRSKMQLAEKR